MKYSIKNFVKFPLLNYCNGRCQWVFSMPETPISCVFQFYKLLSSFTIHLLSYKTI